ncbi:2Fe-2S iron-sulfur cluster-binding protein [Streptomyces sp. NPDC127190]|uniref:2Fe-2S iron-sulfur cluster-binding protein n=1 Tax=unclassified Streptomyces TaxID=2593676 RepID=UPI0036381AE8
MTDDQHAEGTSQGGGRWDPLPQGDYDDGATAFVKLPEGGIDALLAGDSPLAAPGHGYVPPRITPGHADAAPAAWPAPEAAQWPDPGTPQSQAHGQPEAQPPGADDRFTYHPGATQHWTFEEPAAPAAPGHDVTGQWSIPVAGGDLPDESGEYTTSSLVEQWGGTPPATLPGGAPAPWATDGTGHSWGHPAGDTAAPEAYGHTPEEQYGHPVPGPGDTLGGADPAEHAEQADGSGEFAVPTEQHTEYAAPAEQHTEPAEQHAEPVADPAAVHAPADAHAPVDAHAPAQAPEGPADAPAGHEEPAPHAAVPEAADEATGGADGAAAGEAGEAHEADAAAADAADLPAHPEPEPEAPAAETDADAAVPLPPHDDHPLASYVLRVNGADRPVTDAWIGESLLYVLRERLGLAGAKDGCSQGECGACNVQVDGRLVASCLVPAVTAAGSEVRTVEGLAVDGHPSDVQRALARCGAVQCGFCVPGMAMTVHDLLEGNPAPTELETRQALCGNLCRCTGYRGVLDAVQEVVAEREAAHAGTGTDTDEARIPHQAGPGAGGVNPSAFEAPGAFDPPKTAAPGGYPEPHGGYADTPAYGTPGPQDPNPSHDPHYGQDGGQG